MKRILIVLGGGRRGGNTAQLADAFAKGAVEAGHQVETISLTETEVKGCLEEAYRFGRSVYDKE